MKQIIYRNQKITRVIWTIKDIGSAKGYVTGTLRSELTAISNVSKGRPVISTGLIFPKTL